MRLANTRDLGLYVRDRRRGLRMSQADLSVSAHVSRRWLADLEAGKPTIEMGLVFKVLHALKLDLDASPVVRGANDVDLDAIFPLGARNGEESSLG